MFFTLVASKQILPSALFRKKVKLALLPKNVTINTHIATPLQNVSPKGIFWHQVIVGI